ncbi:MAG: GGDEF domain-containing protein [Spirochaetia bacterium]|nr:GGDEF domain-containing protein [Spirochaetia bacterium]
MFSVIAMIGILLTEIICQTLAQYSQATYIFPHKLLNVIGFGLNPIVPYFLIPFAGNQCTVKWKSAGFILPLVVNTILSIASFWTGLLFSVDAMNAYSRGPLFFVTTAICLYYFLWVVTIEGKRLNTYERHTKVFLFLIICFTLITSFLQILNPEILTLNGGLSIALLLYYMFFLDLQFDYDMQTGIKNREAFEKRMLRIPRENKSATLFVFDLNNLKLTNDTFGHKAGDEMIAVAAASINLCFREYGDAYRIGGDEFCVISRYLSDMDAKNLLVDLDSKIEICSRNRKVPISIAHGFSSFLPSEQEEKSPYMVFSEADDHMYCHKAKQKKVLMQE